jgi:hypothetical protein
VRRGYAELPARVVAARHRHVVRVPDGRDASRRLAAHGVSCCAHSMLRGYSVWLARSGEEIDMHLAFAMYHLSAIGKAAFNFDLKVALWPCSPLNRTLMIIPTVMGYSSLRAPLMPPPPIARLPARATPRSGSCPSALLRADLSHSAP